MPSVFISFAWANALCSPLRRIQVYFLFPSGHTRTGSELSAAGSEDSSNGGGAAHAASSAEVDRLLKRISELNEVVEAREGKLVELSRNNHELNEERVLSFGDGIDMDSDAFHGY